MDLFFYIAIIGASMILFSKIQYKMIWDRSMYNGNELALNKTKKNNFFIKIKNIHPPRSLGSTPVRMDIL